MTTQATTFIPFLDRVLGGGHNQSGVFGLLGPTGVGKTHLAMMIAVNSAVGGEPFSSESSAMKTWILFDTESPSQLCRSRILSHAAKIPRNPPCRRPTDQPMCSETSSMEYEVRRVDDLPTFQGNIMAEHARFETASEILDSHLRVSTHDNLLSLNSFDPVTLLAWLESEIVQVAEAAPIGGIVIDSASHLCQLAALPTNQRRFIRDFVQKQCRTWSRRYCCPIWVVNQLNGRSNAYSTLTIQSPHDAARFRGFANLLDACVTLGTRCNSTGVFNIHGFRLNAGKNTASPIPLQFDPDFATIVEADGYRADKKTKSWVRAEDRISLDIETEQYLLSLRKKHKMH